MKGFMKNIAIICLVGLLMVLPDVTPASWAQQNYARSGQQVSYHIGVGDLLQIEVYDEEDLNKEVRVLTDGYISFPLLGSIHAEGQTVRQLEQVITQKLAARFLVNPQVSVFVLEFSNVFFFDKNCRSSFIGDLCAQCHKNARKNDNGNGYNNNPKSFF
jgi:protein involved in polysaccharide export with SLBB domain